MGATIKLDLTSDVTHLVAGNTDSAKYRYVAKLREDVKVLSPSWLEALRDVWMEGDDDMDVAGLEKQYRLPTFYGLRICLTGFDNRTTSLRTNSMYPYADETQRNSGSTSKRLSIRTGLSTMATSPKTSPTLSPPRRLGRSTNMRSTGG
jgi:hypothetical protein